METKTAHSLALLSSVANMRANEFICDFTIKADEKIFPVHRAVLAACSEYFHAMFSSGFRETHEAAVEMKGIDAGAVEHCIDFMYTGEAVLTVEDTSLLLQAADMMRLTALVELCFDHLKANISSENCLSVRRLAQIYSRDELCEFAETFVISKFEDVISTDDFFALNSSDIHRFIIASKNLVTQVNAAKAWVMHDAKQREKVFPEIFESLIKVNKWPFGFVLETVWDEPLVQKFDECKDQVLSLLPTNPETLQDNLHISNAFLINKVMKEHLKCLNIGMKAVIDTFLVKNFDRVSQRPEFEALDMTDVVTILSSSELKCSEEEKWFAMLKWIKRSRQRKKNFPKLLKLIKFEKLSSDFIKETIRNEPLVKESHESKDLVMDALFERISSEKIVAASSTTPPTDETKAHHAMQVISNGAEQIRSKVATIAIAQREHVGSANSSNATRDGSVPRRGTPTVSACTRQQSGEMTRTKTSNVNRTPSTTATRDQCQAASPSSMAELRNLFDPLSACSSSDTISSHPENPISVALARHGPANPMENPGSSGTGSMFFDIALEQAARYPHANSGTATARPSDGSELRKEDVQIFAPSHSPGRSNIAGHYPHANSSTTSATLPDDFELCKEDTQVFAPSHSLGRPNTAGCYPHTNSGNASAGARRFCRARCTKGGPLALERFGPLRGRGCRGRRPRHHSQFHPPQNPFAHPQGPRPHHFYGHGHPRGRGGYHHHRPPAWSSDSDDDLYF